MWDNLKQDFVADGVESRDAYCNGHKDGECGGDNCRTDWGYIDQQMVFKEDE